MTIMRESKRLKAGQTAAVALGLVVALTSGALAVINPSFTPKHLEDECGLIFTVKVAAVDADGKGAALTVGEVLKGQLAAAKVRVDLKALLAMKDGEANAETFLGIVKSAQDRWGVIAAAKPGADAKVLAYLHIEGRWIQLSQGSNAETWSVETVTPQRGTFFMDATFNGGSDMFIETLRFIRKYPALGIMRVEPGASWADHTKLGKLPGKANALMAVDANGDGRLDLFAACPDGDRVFVQDAKGKFTELAGAPGSSSAVAAWADFDGDGRPDLASLGKYGLNVYFQKEPGKFTTQNVQIAGEAQLSWATGSPAMGIVDLEPDGRPDLVIGLNRPLVFKNDGQGGFSAFALPAEEKAPDRGLPGPCVVADFDADGTADIVQTYQKGGVLWRGKAGGFEPPVECGAAMGKVKNRQAQLADVDGDGLLDIFLLGGGYTPHLLANRGGRSFQEVFRFFGEPNYKIQTGAWGAAFGDFNNDTFVDLYVGGEGEERLFFFNRGFRSLAVDERQALAIEEEAMPGIGQGTVAAVWADFGNTGAQSLALALANGDVYLSRTDIGAQPKSRAMRVPVDPAVKSAAPQVMRFFSEGRPLGARVADRWSGPAVMGVEAEGTYAVAWRGPDGKEVRRELEVGDGAASPAGPKAAGGQKTAGGPAVPAPAAGEPQPPAAPQTLLFVGLGAAVLAIIVIGIAVARRKKPGAGS
jgi:hypothetical protein